MYGDGMRAVIDANVKWSRATERRLRLPTDKTLWRRFEGEAAALIRALPDGATVLDLGGGRRCVYASAVEPPGRVRLIAVDISSEELALNEDAAEKYTADVAAGLPLPTSSVDLILSRALLEHVADVPASVRHMARVLKPGGVALHFVPLVRLVHAIMPWTRDQVGFPIYYDSCYPTGLEREFLGSGFSEVETWITWAQPGYFEAIYPLFLLYALYEWITRNLRLRTLAAYTVVRAVR
jgi:SAM-dependent methyltransferase